MLTQRLRITLTCVALACASCVYADLVESRETSWTNNAASFVSGATTSHAGKMVGGEYVDGMWSYERMNYTLDDSASTGSPTDFSDLSLSQMTYSSNNVFGSVFCPDPSDQWSLPISRTTNLITYTSYMGGNNYGTAVSLNNVFSTSIDVAISGSYYFHHNAWGGPYWVDSWILKVSSTGDVTVLFENHTPTENPYDITVDVGAISTTLEVGDNILVALGGRATSGGDNYYLSDAGLVWDITVPEPATMTLLMAGGLIGLKRRK